MAKAAPAPLDARLLGVPKGQAAPAADLAAVEPVTPSSERQGRAGGNDDSVRHTPIARRAPPLPPPVEEPRTALTVRLPLSTQERLREASHRSRREKQSIVDEALTAWLDQNGF